MGISERHRIEGRGRMSHHALRRVILIPRAGVKQRLGTGDQEIHMRALFPDDPLAESIRECVLELLVDRGPGRSICPSEAAQTLGERISCPWQDLMRPVRTVAAALAESGVVEAFQDDLVVNIREVRGPVRLRLRAQHRKGTPRTD